MHYFYHKPRKAATRKKFRVSFLIKKQMTLAQMFSCDFAKFLRTPFVTDHLWITASEPNSMKDLSCKKMGLVTWRNLIKLHHVWRSVFLLHWLQIQDSSRKLELNTCGGKKLQRLWGSSASIDCQGKGENVTWKSKKLRCDIWRHRVIYQIFFWALKWWNGNFTTFPLEKWKFCIWHALCLLRATELSQTHENFDYYFVRCLFVLEIGGTPRNYTWLNSPTIVLRFFG